MNGDGLCFCGCGQKTNIATMNNTRNGAIKGQPRRFIKNHNHRGATRTTSPKGENHYNWKGGTRRAGEYVLKLVEGATVNSGYMLEHIVIATKALGRPLPERAVVHHHNGNGMDNRNSNLVVCQDQNFHLLLHQRQRAYHATGNPNSRKCRFCQEWGLDLKLAKNGNTFHPACVNAYNRRLRAKKKEVCHVN